MRFFIAIFRKEYNVGMDSLNILGTFPLADVKRDYENVLLEILRSYLNKEYEDELCETFVNAAGGNLLSFVKLCLSKWIMDSL